MRCSRHDSIAYCNQDMSYNSRHKQYEACHHIYRRRLSDGSMTRTEEGPNAWSEGYRLQEIAEMRDASLYLSGIMRQVFLSVLQKQALSVCSRHTWKLSPVSSSSSLTL